MRVKYRPLAALCSQVLSRIRQTGVRFDEHEFLLPTDDVDWEDRRDAENGVRQPEFSSH